MYDYKGEIRIIRTLVSISIMAYFSWVFGRLVFWDFIEHEIQKILSLDGMGSKLEYIENEYVFWIFLSAASYLGVFFLKRWGCNLLLLTFLLTCFMAPFSGVMINSPLERLLFMIFWFSDGMIIALSMIAWPSIFNRTKGVPKGAE